MIMNLSRKLAYLIPAATLAVLPAHAPLRADQAKAPAVSAGAASTAGGSLMNVGQAAIGRSRSRTHQMKTGVIPAIVVFANARLRGDLDGDGDVDVNDHGIFAACMNGPDVSTPPFGCTQEQFDLADLQHDVDVDLYDFKDLSNGILLPSS